MWAAGGLRGADFRCRYAVVCAGPGGATARVRCSCDRRHNGRHRPTDSDPEPRLEHWGERPRSALRPHHGSRCRDCYCARGLPPVTTYPILTATTFLPLVGAVAIFLCSARLTRWMALATTLTTLAVSAPLYLRFDKTSSAMQFVEAVPWIQSWNVVYGMGVDGISLPFIFL